MNFNRHNSAKHTASAATVCARIENVNNQFTIDMWREGSLELL